MLTPDTSDSLQGLHRGSDAAFFRHIEWLEKVCSAMVKSRDFGVELWEELDVV